MSYEYNKNFFPFVKSHFTNSYYCIEYIENIFYQNHEMLNLNIKLENKTSYINSLNLFSRAFLLKDSFKEKESILVLCENEKVINEYQKILKFLNINSWILKDNSDLANLFYNKKGLFFSLAEKTDDMILSPKILENDFFDIYIWQEIIVETFIEKINSSWYTFWDLHSPWTYKKAGDTITIFSFCWNFEYKISFWGDQIDEIYFWEIYSWLVRDSEKIDKIYLWKNQAIFQNETSKKTVDFSSFLSKQDCFTILDNLDFSPYYDKLISNLDNFCSFDFVWNKLFTIKDLGFESMSMSNIEDFKKVMSNTLKPIVYTKNKKVIDNFVDFNNLSWIKIIETKLSNLKSFTVDKTISIESLSSLSTSTEHTNTSSVQDTFSWDNDSIKQSEIISKQDTLSLDKYSNKKHVVICDDIIWKVFVKKRIKKNISADIDLLLKINPWDYIVHIDHWVWIFNSILKKDLWWTQREYIEILYKNNDKLFVPIIEISRVNKYVWVENPKLTWLNTKEWEKKINKANVDAQKVAEELLELYSKRRMSKWFPFMRDIKKEENFQSSFPFNYTSDQNETIESILKDMEKDIPMDRLVIWDVWFWKTEIAFNSIFTSFINNKQSILISPLVVLAYEHYEKALTRFREFGMKIWVLTRLETSKNANETIRRLKSWDLDLVIWTHKLLSPDIQYKDLWLMVVDEEHKFWVTDKEKIKKLKAKIDILSMSATPIPRSLNMAMSSLRSMSILRQPPVWRKPIETTVSKFNESIIAQACEKEFSRWWQVFFVHNRVSNIEHFKKMLLNLFPDKKVVVTHWQLPWEQLEKRIIEFKHKKYDILLSTTVIENWIDFSNVNTIFINDAYKFGISQIHQLRWRVWRSDRQWYCYLLYKQENMKDESIQRLKTIVNYSYLWAGFELALKDLEVRGWWDILGIRQSGQTSDIGVNLYLKMIEEKIEELKTKQSLQEDVVSWKKDLKEAEEELVNSKKINTSIDLNISAFIPSAYFSSELDKINFYREVEVIDSLEDLKWIIDDFKVMNPEFSDETSYFFKMLELKLKSQSHKIKSIKKVLSNYQLDFVENIKIPELKKFLDLDIEVKFSVITTSRIRTPVKWFKNEWAFLEYLLNLFDKKVGKRKIKLKK